MYYYFLFFRCGSNLLIDTCCMFFMCGSNLFIDTFYVPIANLCVKLCMGKKRFVTLYYSLCFRILGYLWFFTVAKVKLWLLIFILIHYKIVWEYNIIKILLIKDFQYFEMVLGCVSLDVSGWTGPSLPGYECVRAFDWLNDTKPSRIRLFKKENISSICCIILFAKKDPTTRFSFSPVKFWLAIRCN